MFLIEFLINVDDVEEQALFKKFSGGAVEMERYLQELAYENWTWAYATSPINWAYCCKI